MDLVQEPLKVVVRNKMTISHYPQLIVIERNGNKERYSGYSQTEAMRRFKKKYPLKNKY